ncbi:MAG: hypothetical protein BWY67_00835 [Bacteroidetes bacterium ADurb.Bin397]|nr:MAG: hypothetical protein BWY67_00835 [Bacteroidetes bacterium ADurb.Bin397]
MKKTFTLLIIACIMAIMIPEKTFAQPGTFFPNYFINQTFDGLEALPTGWSGVSNTTCFFGHAAATYVVGSGYLKVSASGSGTRGGELRFPSTATSNFKDSTLWVMEFDWTVNSADWDARQANGFFVMGPNSANVNVNDTWYGDVIFGLYCYKNPDGYFHFLNHDPIGLPKRDAGGAIIPGEFQGPVFYNQNGNNGKFTRQATVKTDWVTADSLNLSTRTKVKLVQGSAFHIFAEMNFKTQKIQKFVMYEIANPANGDTIENKDFLAPWMVGTATTVPIENRIVNQIDRIASFHTRSGGSGALNHSYDNLQLYVWKESVGIADVSIKYVDRSGNSVKENRVVPNQQVTSIVSLTKDDKTNFTSGDGMYYYFYDEEATHAANAAKSTDGESLTVDFTGADNSLTVVFKKVAVTAGTYVWSGDASGKWNYLDDNFKINGGTSMSYQPGNEVSFSNPDALYKTVEVTGEVDLKDANMTISASDYIFGGTGRIVGNGTLMVSAPTTLGSDNRMAAGAIIQTAQPVLVKHANAAAKFKTTEPEITLGLEAGATFTKAIEGTPESKLNLNLISLNEYAPAISGFNTVNIHQMTQTNLNSATWRTGWGGTMPENAQVNYYNEVLDNPIPNGLGVVSAVMQKVKLHLGPHTRLVRQYNENSNNNDVVYVGELTGDAGSRIESGFVDGRYFRYDIGGLGTDAVFNGEIGAFTRSYVPATDTTAAVTTYAANGVGITKSGAGSWTVNGNFNFPKGTRGSQVNVSGGKFIINGDILFPNYTKEGSQINVTGAGLLDINGKVTFVTDSAAHVIKVTDGTLQLHDSIVAPAINQIALTVDANGTLKTGNNFIGASTVTVNGVVEGGGKYANAFSMTNDLAVLKLNVNNFEEGNYEFVDALGDISIKKGIIDITVLNSPIGSKQITILKAGGNYDILDNMAFIQVLVNGKNITGNTPQTEVPEGGEIYYFDPETGILGHLGVSGINDVNASKEVKNIEYFNMVGQKVTKYHLGYTLKRITYTDNSVETIKFFNQERLIELNDQK